MENQGRIVEDYIEKLCAYTFFSDFIVRSPKYTKSKGREKEIADILLVFNDILIPFQVKTKIEIKKGSEKKATDFKRIEKKIEDAAGQLKVSKDAFDNDLIQDLVSARGLPIEFRKEVINKLYGIVILDLIGEEEFEDSEKTGAFGGFIVKHDMPIHVFMRDEFEVILNCFDTLPDFLEYLETRQLLKEKNYIPILTSELDLVACIKMNPEVIQDCKKGVITKLILHETWSGFEDEYIKILLPSYRETFTFMIDHVINILHKTIGHETEFQLPNKTNVENLGTPENYLQIAKFLGKFNREERRIIGKKFVEKMVKADKKGNGHTIIMSQDKTEGLLFYSTSSDRQSRGEEFYLLCASAYCLFGLVKIVGITTDPASARERSYDFIFMEGVSFSNKVDLIEFGKTQFNLHHIH